MPRLMSAPPFSLVDDVTEILHGIPVTDPFRWLEDQDSPRTREWLDSQHEYARSYLDSIPGRDRIRNRIRELVDVETHDSIQKTGRRYFFRKRQPGQEQPCIYFREGAEGADQLLVNPAERGAGPYTAVKPLRVSADGRLLLYEVKDGGERAGTFELVDIETGATLSDILPHGYLRGFAFAPDSESFYYVHEPPRKPRRSAVVRHRLGTSFEDDEEIFFAGTSESLRLHIVLGHGLLGFLVQEFKEKTLTDFYLWNMGDGTDPRNLVKAADFKLVPLLIQDDLILALTDRDAPNFRIVQICPQSCREGKFVDVVPTGDSAIQGSVVAGERIFVSYIRDLETQVDIFDLSGRRLGQLPGNPADTVRLLGASENGDEIFFESESFTKPSQIYSYLPRSGEVRLWAERKSPFESEAFGHTQVWITAKDGTPIPMFLVGRRDVLERGPCPTIMTSYGGYGVPVLPQFSVFVAFLMERGCLFALPNIRGGSEFGAEWHQAAKRRTRQVACDDFLAAAEWLVTTGRTSAQKLAIFGGSNSGLLVGMAITQRPDLFRAAVCMVPMLDMLRYHLFDNAHVWKDEFGTADDPDDFAALLRYSPYHKVRDRVRYPAVLFVSGDADQKCNALHARKMTARLQAANASEHPILLDYNRHRGHSPVLPLSERIAALTDRMAFLCDQLGLPA
jgi:prolyl oligopeptidase